MLKCRGAFCLLLLLLVGGFSQILMAQAGVQASLEGTVTDPSGAVVSGAAVKLNNVDTGIGFTTASNDSGYFRFPVVPLGKYELTVDGKSFAPYTQRSIDLTVGAKVNLEIKLGVAASENVEVTSTAPIVETTRTSVSSTVDSASVSELPVNGRNFLDFALLTPGVTRDVRTGDLSFAGLRGTLNSLTVDGADNNNKLS